MPSTDPAAQPIEFAVPAGADGRLDLVLTESLGAQGESLSRSRVQSLIRDGHATCDGVTIREPKHRVKPGVRVCLAVPPPVPATPEAEAIALKVVFEDEHLIVINKPAGLVVHPAAGHATGTLVNALIAHCGDSLSGIGGERRPGIVHRLDKDTTGLMVVAKSDRAHQGLSEQFAAHGADGRMQRAYLAVAWGTLARPRLRIEAPLGRHATDRTRMAVVPEAAGRHAATNVAVEAVFHGADGTPIASLIRCELETGRTHQIRVHLAHIGHPLLGDPLYGRGFVTRAVKLPEPAQAALSALARQALHATVLGFEHPIKRRPMVFEAPPPADLTALIGALRTGLSRAR